MCGSLGASGPLALPLVEEASSSKRERNKWRNMEAGHVRDCQCKTGHVTPTSVPSMGCGHPGLTGQTALQPAGTGLGPGRGRAPHHLLNMEGRIAVGHHMQCRIASSGIAQFTASGWTSPSGLLAVHRVMGAPVLAFETLYQHSTEETTAVEI